MGRQFDSAVGMAVLALVVPACFSSSAREYRGPWLHRSFYEEPCRRLPRKVVRFPARVEQFELPTESTPHAPLLWVPATDRGRRDTETVDRVLGPWMREHAPIEIVGPPELSGEESASIDEHLALFSVVADAVAGSRQGTPDFRLREFEYTVGPGLRGLRDRCGAEAALLVTGSFVHLLFGIVDLETGDVLWLARGGVEMESESGVVGFTEEGVRKALEGAWNRYPNRERFERVREDA